MSSRAWIAVLLVAIAGCPAGGSRSDGAASATPGERWRFRCGPGVEQVYQVTALSPQEVRYTVLTMHGGEPLGRPLEQAFPLRPGPTPLLEGEPGPPLKVGGRTLETWVVEEGGQRITTAVTGRTPTFPGVVRVERGDEVLLELIDVR